MNITATLIIQIIAFVIFIALINKFLWKPLSDLMSARQKRIEDGLTAAERGQAEQKEAEQKVEEIISQSKHQAVDIIDNAKKQASTIINAAKDTASLEAEKIKLSSSNEIAQEISKVKTQLQSQLSSLVILGVTKVLEKEVNEQDHKQMLAKLSKSL